MVPLEGKSFLQNPSEPFRAVRDTLSTPKRGAIILPAVFAARYVKCHHFGNSRVLRVCRYGLWP